MRPHLRAGTVVGVALTRLTLGLLVLTFGCVQARAPEPRASPAPPTAARSPRPLASHADALEAASKASKGAIRVEVASGPVPWTHLTPLNDDASFQFAIVSDRTGGMRNGVFDAAVRKLNLLEPEFVVSVGDLIEGYSENHAKLKAEWDEFDALVRGIQAPFFYVPGNHDLSNDVMREVWRERYGNSYYSFIYENVLFLCLNSMDGDLHRVSEAQVQWLRSELGKHQNVRWTLLFLHTPLWDHPQVATGESDAWSPIRAALGSRRYTAFAGHHHRYVKRELEDRKHFTLATTGGGSALRGPAYGEFDHVVWVTMTAEGPKLANLMLDGIWDEDVRTDALRSFQDSVLSVDTLKPNPIYYEGRFRRGKSQVRVRNDRDVPLRVRMSSSPSHGFLVQPAELEVELPPNSVSDYEFLLTSRLTTTLPATKLPLAWSVSGARGAPGEPFELTGATAIGLVRLQTIPRTGRRVLPDGLLREWGRLSSVAEPAQVLRNALSYHGKSDSSFEVGLSHSALALHIAVNVKDDHVQANKETLPWDQDGIEVRVDARPDPMRAHSQGSFDGQRFLTIAMSPSGSADDDWYAPRHLQKPEGVEASSVRTRTGFVTELSIPKRLLVAGLGGSPEFVRINIAVNDGDPDGQSQLWWWPDWRSADDIPGSGSFKLH